MFDGNTSVKIGEKFLRANNVLGDVAYWWGGRIKATEAMLKYFQYQNQDL